MLAVWRAARHILAETAARGGHFAAFQQPPLFVAEVRVAFRAICHGVTD